MFPNTQCLLEFIPSFSITDDAGILSFCRVDRVLLLVASALYELKRRRDIMKSGKIKETLFQSQNAFPNG
jgi:hypothetical protein